VTLQGWRSQYAVQKFAGFLLTADPADSKIDTSPETAGHFQLFGDAFTRFSDLCPNAITQTSSTPKTEVQVLWTAPGPGSGCILFRSVSNYIGSFSLPARRVPESWRPLGHFASASTLSS
jgi:hypothetical protein